LPGICDFCRLLHIGKGVSCGYCDSSRPKEPVYDVVLNQPEAMTTDFLACLCFFTVKYIWQIVAFVVAAAVLVSCLVIGTHSSAHLLPFR